MREGDVFKSGDKSMEDIVIGSDGKVKLPQPGEIEQRAKEDAMGGCLMMFAAWGIGLPLPFLGLIASLIYYFINKKNSRFVAFHTYQSLLFHSFVSVLNAFVVIWGVVALLSDKISLGAAFYVFLIFTIIWNLIYMALSIIACVKANKGQFYYFLVFGRMSFNKFYGPKALAKQNGPGVGVKENIPPQGF
jgi:uncharacterized Tic20 family protein